MNESRRVSLRSVDGHYNDQDEAEFAFEMHVSTGWELHAIDNFLEDPRVPQEVRDHLIEKRLEAIHSYKQGHFELALAQFETLHLACCIQGPRIKRTEDRRKGGKAAAQSRAKLPEKDSLQREIAELIAANRDRSERDARGIIARRYGVTPQAVRQRLNPPTRKKRK